MNIPAAASWVLLIMGITLTIFSIVRIFSDAKKLHIKPPKSLWDITRSFSNLSSTTKKDK